MNRLEHGVVGPDVGTRGYAQAAHQARGQVAGYVAIQVGEHDDIELARVHHHVHAERVDDAVVEGDAPLVALRHLTGLAQEQPVGVLHDVGLVGRGHLAAPLLQGVVEGVVNDAARGRHRYGLDGYARVGADGASLVLLDEADELKRLGAALLELHARVQVLGVLAHDDQVHVVVTAAGPRNGKHRAQAHVQVERLPQRHVHAAEARAHRRGGRALDAHLVALDRLDGLLGQRRAAALGALGARVGHLPGDVGTSGSHHFLHGRGSLDAYAVARYERYGVLGHGCLPSSPAACGHSP